jgi:hypothetical protein
MYVDRETALRAEFPPLQVDIERGRLRLFAKAIGETNPVYTDLEAARRAGYPDLPVPASFLGNSIELDIPDPMGWVRELGADTSSTLHAEQSFTYHKMAFAGDSVVLHRKIVDVYTKKGGALEFIIKQTDITRGDELLATTWFVLAVRHPEVAA